MQSCFNSEYAKTAISGNVSGILAMFGDVRQRSGTTGSIRGSPATFREVRQCPGISGLSGKVRKSFPIAQCRTCNIWMNSVSN